MLSHLVIRNFAIIDHLEIPFQSGLTVLSGETGAGKSIIINALNLVLGGRASTDVIRSDADQAVVEAIFDLNPFHRARIGALLEELGIDDADGQLVIRRIVSRSGRNKVLINGSLSTASILQGLSAGLVDISGQHEHYSLMKREKHLDILDGFGVLGELAAQMKARYLDLKKIRDELASIQADDRDRLNRIDFLQFQLAEIDDAGLTVGEDEALAAELNLLKNAEKISKATKKARYLAFEGDGSAVERIAEAEHILSRVTGFDANLEALVEQIAAARISLEEAAREVGDFGDQINMDERRLDEVIRRVDAIKHLQRKHGGDIAAILEHASSMRSELSRLENAEERGAELVEGLEKANQAALKVAKKLGKERRQAAKLLERSIETELEQLNMARTKMVVDFQVAPEVGPTGSDAIEFLLAANLGEDPKPLTKIASGGELSRIMLAIKTVLAERDSISTYIFDEVDTGIGGSTADLVGEKIAATSKNHQVFCITHLPQIASRGDLHYLVEKTSKDGRTQSLIRPLPAEERVGEIARMLGGARVTAKTKEAAAELLKSE